MLEGLGGVEITVTQSALSGRRPVVLFRIVSPPMVQSPEERLCERL
jgi:hypothetical protein